jgi:Bacterial Ig domain/Calx-beta domain
VIIQQRKPRRAGIGIAASTVAMLVGLVFGSALPAAAAPGDLTLVSTSGGGVKGDGLSQLASIALFSPYFPGGPFVAFESSSTNLDPADTDASADIYVKNVATGEVTLVSTSTSGVKGNADSNRPAISTDGRYVAFQSAATNLLPADTDALSDIYLKDLVSGQLDLVSVSESKGNGDSTVPSISNDQLLTIAFQSTATNLDPADTDPFVDVYVKDMFTTGELTLASTSDTGVKGDGDSILSPNSLTIDPPRIAFSSNADNLDPDDPDTLSDVYVKNLDAGDLTLASFDGDKGNADSASATISSDGFVAFESLATNFDPSDHDSLIDVYVKDLASGFLRLASTSDDGEKGDGASVHPSIAGTTVAFASSATNLDPGDTDAVFDVYVKDLLSQDLALASTTNAGVKANDHSRRPVVAGGSLIAFETLATNLDPADTDLTLDVYLKERGGSANTSPTAGDDAYSTDEGIALSVPSPGVLGNDTDADGDQLSASLVSGPAHGTATLGIDGSFLYEPVAGFDGIDAFTYVANDGSADSNVAMVTITVDPAPACTGICLSIDDVSVAEGNKSSTKATFTISLSAPSQNPVTVVVESIDGTAIQGVDYQPFGRKTLSFKGGRTSMTVSVRMIGDRLLEPDETFFVQLSSPVNAGISDGEGLGTILNDD